MNQHIKEMALSVGFDACGIAKAEDLSEDREYFRQWIEKGFHGEMKFLERNQEKRFSPTTLVPNCKSVIVLLLNYYPSELQNQEAPQLAKYAYSKIDYHTVIKSKLGELEKLLIDQYGENIFNSQHQHSFVDSAPVLEKRWAEKAGIGWIGKNKLLISPKFGSYVFIATIFINKLLESYDISFSPQCHDCNKCIEACPTKALNKDGLDARKCISYSTIEKKSDYQDDGNCHSSKYIVGCDICSDCCPWNKKLATPHKHLDLTKNSEILEWDIKKWNNLSETEYKNHLTGSSIGRIKYKHLKENINVILKKER